MEYKYKKDSTILSRVIDNADIDSLNDFELGQALGYTLAKSHYDFQLAKSLLNTNSLDFNKGISSGYCTYAESLPYTSGNVVDSIKNYLKDDSFENFLKILDDVEDKEYVLLEKDNDYTLGYKVKKDKLDEVNKLLEENKDLEIKSEDDDSVIVGDKDSEVKNTSDSLVNAYNKASKNYWKYIKDVATDYGYNLTLFGLFTKNGEFVTDSFSVTMDMLNLCEVEPTDLNFVI